MKLYSHIGEMKHIPMHDLWWKKLDHTTKRKITWFNYFAKSISWFIQQTPLLHNLHCPNNNTTPPRNLQHKKQEYTSQHSTPSKLVINITTSKLLTCKNKETKMQSSPSIRAFLPSPSIAKSLLPSIFSSWW